MTNKIRKLRKEQALRQSDLADRVQVSRQTIIAIENGKYNPSLVLAIKLARVLGTTVEDLFSLDD
ncbi:MAG TPA: helix-turn-helix transcriptional regulator [Bacillota bacterium]|jgi:putative transcriptional regulator|nr:helix-turn-helix transcriptional regulator [Fastidiosipila sp.]HPX93799.1 helix-turn-helix transcriptional regulator [Bacillota bacterium]HQB81624.1 helix-turn-helix transcriptional regulator [Bacillota bacterium]